MSDAALFIRPAGEAWVVVAEGRPSYPHYSYASAFDAAIGKARLTGAERVFILDRDGRRQVEHVMSPAATTGPARHAAAVAV